MLTDHIAVGYEFRQKTDPYGTIASNEPGEWLVGPEDNWHAVEVGYIINKRTNVVRRLGPLRQPGQLRSKQLVVDATEVRVLDLESL